MSEVILFTSGKGGVGKTTITANIGAGLAARGFKTVIADMNQGLRGMDIVLGLGNLVVYNIQDALQKRCKLSKVLVKDPNRENLSLLPPSQVRKQQDIDPEALKEMILELKKHFDYVLIDGCSGLDLGFEHSALCYDRAVIVCTGDVLSVRAADRVKEVLRRTRPSSLSFLLNRLQPELVREQEQMGPEEVEEILGLDLLGVIPRENILYSSSNKGETITGSLCPSGQALFRITSRLLGENIPVPEFQTEDHSKSGFWSFFRKG